MCSFLVFIIYFTVFCQNAAPISVLRGFLEIGDLARGFATGIARPKIKRPIVDSKRFRRGGGLKVAGVD